MWSRAATQARADALVQAYNASHKNHIDVTFVPTDDYQTKVGAAAAANSLPDLFSADVVFMPNWTSAGLFQDLTARIATLPFAANIAQGAVSASTWDGKKYGLPFVVDLSVWMYNKKLFKEAGLDPAKPPKSLPSSRPTPARSRSWAATSTEPSSAATAPVATCSPGGRLPGPTATRS